MLRLVLRVIGAIALIAIESHMPCIIAKSVPPARDCEPAAQLSLLRVERSSTRKRGAACLSSSYMAPAGASMQACNSEMGWPRADSV